MNLLRKMVIGTANRYNQLMTYMQIFKTLNNSPPPPTPLQQNTKVNQQWFPQHQETPKK